MPPSSQILGDPHLGEKTEILIGSESYNIEAQSPASHEDEREIIAPNTRALLDDPTVGDVTDDDQPAKVKAMKKKSRAKPANIDYVLAKSKNITVGISADSPGARAQNEDRAFVPASITKIVTTAAALHVLGANFKFKTNISFEMSPKGQATNLVISSDGDPTFGAAAFESEQLSRMKQIASAFKARGVRELVGEMRLVSFDPRLDRPVYAPGIPAIDVRECYGSLASSFNFRENCAPVRINAKTGFAWAAPELSAFVTSTTSTSAADRNRLRLEPRLSPDRALLGFQLEGTYASKAPAIRQLRLPIGDGAPWFANELLAALRAQKISVGKVSVILARTNAERQTALTQLASQRENLIVIESAPLAEIVKATNKLSDNFIADAVFKALGARSSPAQVSLMEGSRAKMKDLVQTWLQADGRLNWAAELEFVEGAGLSNDNRASPRAFLSLLRQIALEPTFESVWQSLPIAGVDGTLETRMRNTAAHGLVRAKTGTLAGSYQMVGYVPKIRNGQTNYVPFVVLTSTTARNRDVVRAFQDALVAKIAETVADQDELTQRP